MPTTLTQLIAEAVREVADSYGVSAEYLNMASPSCQARLAAELDARGVRVERGG